MGLWNYCEVCGERIETGEPCIGVKEKSENLCGASICINCAKIENLPDGKELVSITDLIASAEAAEARAEKAERDEKTPKKVLEAIDELVEFARERMSMVDWLYYANVIGAWRGQKEE